ncbi:hypothetical protein CGRA01v4_12541 [Colletotrichum graminicola]|nr:hypothetical protein CGRA01v4_12541 [Colletotrichum graminicola]
MPRLAGRLGLSHRFRASRSRTVVFYRPICRTVRKTKKGNEARPTVIVPNMAGYRLFPLLSSLFLSLTSVHPGRMFAPGRPGRFDRRPPARPFPCPGTPIPEPKKSLCHFEIHDRLISPWFSRKETAAQLLRAVV